MENAKHVALVITTFNRCDLLSEALQSVKNSTGVQVSDALEVLVVDNNSTDNTRQVVEEFQRAGYPFELRYIFESKQGLSQARNRGAQEASAEYIAFMDDDQRLDSNFLCRLELEFEHTGADCLGGPIFYYNAKNPPAWVLPLIEDVGQYDGGRKVKNIVHGERLLNGGNMAFRRSVLLSIGGYNTELGRSGANLVGSEEMELQRRLMSAGKQVIYSPNIVQYHYLRPERLKRNYWRRHRFGVGQTLYREMSAAGRRPVGRRVLGVPGWMLINFVTRDITNYAKSVVLDSSSARFDRELRIFTSLGQIYEARSYEKR